MSLLALVTVTIDGRENVSAYFVVGKEHYCTGGIHVTVPYKMGARIPIKERLNWPTTTHLVPQFSCQSTHRLEPSGENLQANIGAHHAWPRQHLACHLKGRQPRHLGHDTTPGAHVRDPPC